MQLFLQSWILQNLRTIRLYINVQFVMFEMSQFNSEYQMKNLRNLQN